MVGKDFISVVSRWTTDLQMKSHYELTVDFQITGNRLKVNSYCRIQTEPLVDGGSDTTVRTNPLNITS